jgi:hypothetical protein
MHIAPGGNVGIGTTSPGAKLDIVSTVSGSEGLRVDGTGGGFAFVVKGGSDYTSHMRAGATIGVNYFTTPPSNGLIVEGNVGIGTTSPTGRLTIAPYATSNSSSIEFTGADNAVISSYYSQVFAVDNTNTQTGRQFTFAKGGKGYGTQTKTMMVIDADSGNVGI